jgi:hypothetical protein
MKIETCAKDPEEITEENLTLNGRVIGWVKTKQKEDAYRVHVGIEFERRLHFSLIQGHGPTIEIATQNAIRDARRDVSELLQNVERLDAELTAE